MKRLWAGLLLVALCAGCKHDRTAVNPDPTGAYTLVSVDGKAVPCNIKHEGRDELLVKSGSFHINADGTCRSRITFVPPPGREVAREVTATYTLSGSQLTMKWQGAGTTTGEVQGKRFTMVNEGLIFAYEK